MTIKSTLSIIALVTALSGVNIYAVRVAHPALRKELNAYFAAHSKTLSKEARSACASLEKNQDVDAETLKHVLREMQEHGFGVRKQSNPMLKRARQNQVK